MLATTHTAALFALAAMITAFSTKTYSQDLVSPPQKNGVSNEKPEKIRHLAPSMEGMKFRDAATHRQLLEKLRSARKTNPMKGLKVKELEKDPSTEHTPGDFIKNSDILCLNGMATFVPKRSILNLPERYANRFILKKGAKVKTFKDFYARNRSWVMAYEVGIEQAFGKKPFDEKKIEWLRKSGRVVVATFKGGPITVLPYVEETEDDKTTEKDPKS